MRFGFYPAFVKSYDAPRRRARVVIDGLTDDKGLEAEILYPLGDKAKDGQYATEIEILAGDMVWLQFIGGDERYPLIVGYRHGETGNQIDWRRWHEANIEAIADKVIRLIATEGPILIKTNGTVNVEAGDSVNVTATNAVNVKAQTVSVDCSTATVKSSGSTTVQASSVSINAPTTTVSGALTVNGAFSATAGAAISGGSGASITGSVRMVGGLKVTGSITASGSINDNTP